MAKKTREDGMWPLRAGPQVDGIERWFGFTSRREWREAKKSIRRDPAMIDALGPDAIVDITRHGHVEYVRGSDDLCRALADAVRDRSLDEEEEEI